MTSSRTSVKKVPLNVKLLYSHFLKLLWCQLLFIPSGWNNEDVFVCEWEEERETEEQRKWGRYDGVGKGSAGLTVSSGLGWKQALGQMTSFQPAFHIPASLLAWSHKTHHHSSHHMQSLWISLDAALLINIIRHIYEFIYHDHSVVVFFKICHFLFPSALPPLFAFTSKVNFFVMLL